MDLTVNHNKIILIEKFDVKNLQWLFLPNNKITSIDKFDVKNLKLLHLEGNPLKHISKQFIEKVRKNNIQIDIDLSEFE